MSCDGWQVLSVADVSPFATEGMMIDVVTRASDYAVETGGLIHQAQGLENAREVDGTGHETSKWFG